MFCALDTAFTSSEAFVPHDTSAMMIDSCYDYFVSVEVTSMAELPRARVLDVGQCDPDHETICSYIEEYFNAEVDRVATIDEAMLMMRKQGYDLVLVNRVIDGDGSDGLGLIRRAKREELTLPIMLVSNYTDAQSAAVAAGGVPGFGKANLRSGVTYEHLARFLPVRKVEAT